MENTSEIKRIDLDEETLRDLDRTRKWSMFLAILGFIAIGLLLIIGLVAGIFLSAFKTESVPLGAGESVIVFAILVVFALIYFFPVFYLYRFSKHAGHAVKEVDNDHMKKAFKFLRNYYVYIGILTIIVLVTYIIIIIASGASLAFLKDMGTGI